MGLTKRAQGLDGTCRVLHACACLSNHLTREAHRGGASRAEGQSLGRVEVQPQNTDACRCAARWEDECAQEEHVRRWISSDTDECRLDRTHCALCPESA